MNQEKNDPTNSPNNNPQEAFSETHQVAYEFIPKGRHTWRQQGYYLVCKSCDLQHSVFIGPSHIMVGEDKEGQPILKKR